MAKRTALCLRFAFPEALGGLFREALGGLFRAALDGRVLLTGLNAGMELPAAVGLNGAVKLVHRSKLVRLRSPWGGYQAGT